STTMSFIACTSHSSSKTPCGGWRAAAWPPALYRYVSATALGGDVHAQGVQLDEALGILLVVGAGIVLEGGDVGVERRIVLRLAAGDDDVALVQLEAHHAVHVFLRGIDHRLQHLALR